MTKQPTTDQSPKSSMCGSCISLLLAIAIGALLALSPKGVSPPAVPASSYTKLIPPWPILLTLGPLSDMLRMAADALTPPDVLVRMKATAYWQSEVQYALVKNGIPDAMDAEGVAGVTCAKVAQDLDLSEFVTCRYMAAAMQLGLLNSPATASNGKKLFVLSSAGKFLRTDTPGNAVAFTLMINEETAKAWRAAGTKSIKTGEKGGFMEAFGEGVWTYHAKHPEKEKQFDMAMEAVAPSMIGAILADYAPPNENVTFCDIGGGQGTVVANFLQHYPGAKGKLFDQTSVVANANAYLATTDVGDRVEVVGGSFFEPLPKTFGECDVFFLKFILHDWDDASAIKILKNVLAVSRPGSVLTNADFILGSHPSRSSLEQFKALMDINMLASCPMGARERSLADFKDLFSAAGITGNVTQYDLRDPLSVVEVALHE
mmetsp:Transcript_34356/g.58193  ORF Transcript_34356/g.58193 Transcript_34356/m.58193 type:complete len:431 (+) Transcript_34356:84-1376(+)